MACPPPRRHRCEASGTTCTCTSPQQHLAHAIHRAVISSSPSPSTSPSLSLLHQPSSWHPRRTPAAPTSVRNTLKYGHVSFTNIAQSFPMRSRPKRNPTATWPVRCSSTLISKSASNSLRPGTMASTLPMAAVRPTPLPVLCYMADIVS
jgi:hypothetical protein